MVWLRILVGVLLIAHGLVHLLYLALWGVPGLSTVWPPDWVERLVA